MGCYKSPSKLQMESDLFYVIFASQSVVSPSSHPSAPPHLTSYGKPLQNHHFFSSSPMTAYHLYLEKDHKSLTTFRGLGCTASSQVSMSVVIRSSAD
nr:E3 ubiquitin-protein ligase RNF6 isoform X1 [Ipomoea batatas]